MKIEHALNGINENPDTGMRKKGGPCRSNNDSTSTMYENPQVIMTVLMETMKIQYVLKGINENPETRMSKKKDVALFTC